jgi:hypothetical protein
MKTKYFLLGLGALLIAGGIWTVRVAWRVHRQLVTLDVRNAPLAQVLRKIEWQTWKKIRAENSLDARITLHVTDKPLQYVLDRLAEQAGARWSTVYAVYQSAPALKALETALQSDGKLEPVGWTKIAPKMPGFGEPDAGDPGPFFRSGVNPGGAGPASDPGSQSFDALPGKRMTPAGGPPPLMGNSPNEEPPPMMPRGGRMMFRRNLDSGGVMISQDANGQTEMWSPEELVMESVLGARLGTEANPEPSSKAAAETARKVNGKWTSYVALRKSIMGVGFVGHTPGRPGSDPLKHEPNDRFARLTPEQRVQRERERRGMNLNAENPKF